MTIVAEVSNCHEALNKKKNFDAKWKMLDVFQTGHFTVKCLSNIKC